MKVLQEFRAYAKKNGAYAKKKQGMCQKKKKQTDIFPPRKKQKTLGMTILWLPVLATNNIYAKYWAFLYMQICLFSRACMCTDSISQYYT